MATVFRGTIDCPDLALYSVEFEIEAYSADDAKGKAAALLGVAGERWKAVVTKVTHERSTYNGSM